MPIIDQVGLNNQIEINKDDGYGECICNVAIEIMRLLDLPEHKEFDPDNLISLADNKVAGGITGFMAGAAASMVYHYHSRGEEFRRAYNKAWGVSETAVGIVNPALMEITLK